MPTFHEIPVAEAAMLIRRPVREVFEAFVNPAITTRFWFTKSSGPLEAGKSVRWDWEMYGVSTTVEVKALEENRRIVIEWESSPGNTTVEWIFTERGESETFVAVTESGFQGDGDDIVKLALDSTGGFTMVLCALKALLEFNVVLNVVADKAPDANVSA